MTVDYGAILNLDPVTLANWVLENFYKDLPAQIINAEDMEQAGKLLLELSAGYSYVNALLSYAKILSRNAKRTGKKEIYEDLVDKKEVLQNAADSIKQQYNAVSRAVTIKMSNDAELKMMQP